jgi:hypothetical protein
MCKNYLAMEREKKVWPLNWPMFDVSTSFLHRLCFFCSKKFACWHIDLCLGWSGVAAQAAVDKSSMKAQVDGLAADNSLLKTRVDSLVAEVTQLKADQAKAQELHEKHQAEAELKEESLRQRL